MLSRLETKSDRVISSTDVEKGLPSMTRQASDPVTRIEVVNAQKRFEDLPIIPIFLPRSMHKSMRNMASSERFVKTFVSYRASLKVSNPLIETFLCAICGENESIFDSFVTKTCPHSHRYCLTCMKHWVSTLIDDGTTILHCPDVSCVKSLKTSILDSDEVKLLTTAEVFGKYTRFKNLHGNDHYRECPSCGTSVVHDDAVGPEIVCSKCSMKYCFMHGNAHSSMSCDKYAKKINDELKASTLLINRITKKCPQCNAPTEKNNGCNHITCKICRTNWCWICGRAMENVTSHYTDNSRDGCPGLQFTDPGCNCRYICWRFCATPCQSIFPCCSWAICTSLIPDSLYNLALLAPVFLFYVLIFLGGVIGGLLSVVIWIPGVIYAVIKNPDATKDCRFFFDVILNLIGDTARIFSAFVICMVLVALTAAWSPIGMFGGFVFALFPSVIAHDHYDFHDDFLPFLFLPTYAAIAFMYHDDS